MFQRINKYSVTLTPQELRKARFKGEFLDTITQLGENEFWVLSRLFSPNDFRRMNDLEYIGVLLSTMIGGIYNRQDRLDEFYVNYEKEFEDKEYYINRFENVINLIGEIFPDIRISLWKSKANFYTLFLLVDNLLDLFDDKKGIQNIRKRLNEFSNLIGIAKEDPEAEDVNEEILSYLDASTYGTNDKEKRVRRLRILKDFVLAEDVND